MDNRFIVSVANVRAYAKDEMGEDMLVFSSKTMLNTSIDISTGSTEISGGKRNKLLNVLYHSGRFNITLEDTVYNMEWIKLNTGAKEITAVIPTSVGFSGALVPGSISLPAGSNVAAPFDGSSVAYGWLTKEGIETERVVISSQAFTLDSSSKFANVSGVCLEYYTEATDNTSIAIPAAIIPQRVRLFMDVDIASNKAGEGVIGQMIIEVPVCQLSGAQTINMTADGYSTMPLTGMALAYTPSTGATNPCDIEDEYCRITTYIKGEHWYNGVNSIVAEDLQANADGTYTAKVFAIGNNTKLIPNSKFTFTLQGTPAGITVGANTGIVTISNSGATPAQAIIDVVATEKPSLVTSIVVDYTQGE